MICDWVDVFARDERLANLIPVEAGSTPSSLYLSWLPESRWAMPRDEACVGTFPFSICTQPISGPTSDRTSDHLLEPTTKTGDSVRIDFTLIFILTWIPLLHFRMHRAMRQIISVTD